MRILVTGASGFVGERLCRSWHDQHELVGLVHRRRPDLPIELVSQDLSEEPCRVTDLLDGLRPELVIHAAARSQPRQVAEEPAAARRINVEAAYWIALWCRNADRPLIAFSSDTVYPDAASTTAPATGWNESGPTGPVNSYAASKLEMEQEVGAAFPEACLLRSSLLWGHSAEGQNSFSRWLLARYAQPDPVPVFHDNLRHPLAVSQLTSILERLIADWRAGPLNLGSAELLSRDAIARRLFTHMGLDLARLNPGRTEDAQLLEPIPLSLPLDLGHLSDLLGGRLPGFDEALAGEYPQGDPST